MISCCGESLAHQHGAGMSTWLGGITETSTWLVGINCRSTCLVGINCRPTCLVGINCRSTCLVGTTGTSSWFGVIIVTGRDLSGDPGSLAHRCWRHHRHINIVGWHWNYINMAGGLGVTTYTLQHGWGHTGWLHQGCAQSLLAHRLVGVNPPPCAAIVDGGLSEGSNVQRAGSQGPRI